MNSYMRAQAAANSSFVAFADVQALHISNSGSTVENVNGTNFNVLTSTAVNVKLSDYRHETTTVQRSEEHTSELQSLMRNSYAVFCLKKKKHIKTVYNTTIQETKRKH